MKPQDLALILKLILLEGSDWKVVDVARSLHLSQSEVSKALKRLAQASLLDDSKRVPAKAALYDFLVSGVKHVFPGQLGRLMKGLPTAHSASPLKDQIVSNDAYVWPHVSGTVRGESLEPLYEKAPDAALEDPKFYELLSLIDALRIGKTREQELAKNELKKRILT